jgi:hypothetical protein
MSNFVSDGGELLRGSAVRPASIWVCTPGSRPVEAGRGVDRAATTPDQVPEVLGSIRPTSSAAIEMPSTPSGLRGGVRALTAPPTGHCHLACIDPPGLTRPSPPCEVCFCGSLSPRVTIAPTVLRAARLGVGEWREVDELTGQRLPGPRRQATQFAIRLTAVDESASSVRRLGASYMKQPHEGARFARASDLRFAAFPPSSGGRESVGIHLRSRQMLSTREGAVVRTGA